jgi:hypothetical protein
MIFWLVLKFEINYYRVIMSWRILVSLGGFLLKITFLHGEIFKFPLFFFFLQIIFNVNGKATMWHTPYSTCPHNSTRLYNINYIIDIWLLSQISMTISTKLKIFHPNDLKLDLQPRLKLANIVIHIHSPTTKVVQIKWWWVTITIWRSTFFICKVYL